MLMSVCAKSGEVSSSFYWKEVDKRENIKKSLQEIFSFWIIEMVFFSPLFVVFKQSYCGLKLIMSS